MKPQIGKLKNSRGRIVGYLARLGPVQGESRETSAKAVESCKLETSMALERLDRGSNVLRWGMHTIVVSPTVQGWSYWLDTFSTRAFQNVPRLEREDAENDALHHLAQTVWTPDVPDDAFLTGLPDCVQAELRPWIRFQRSYKALRAEGKSDVEAHREACR